MASDVAIIGAGLTGLLVGYELSKLGVDFTIYEAKDRPGGVVESFHEDGFLAEHGPHTFLERGRIKELVEELGLASERVYANDVASKRFAVRNGTVAALPSSPQSFFNTPLYSPGAKLRLLMEPWIAPREDAIDESVTSFVTRRLGPEFLDYGIDLLVNGIWAGDPNKLSARFAFKRMFALEKNHGSLIRGAIAMAKNGSGGGIPKLFGFREGNQTFVDALASAIGADHLEVSSPLTKLAADGEDWKVTTRKNGRSRTRKHRRVLICIPIHALEKVKFEHPNGQPEPPIFGDRVTYPPVGVVTLGFKRSQVNHPMDGFGMLVPEVEDRDILGTMFTSTLFPGRVPSDDYCTIAVFVGGERHRDKILEWDDAARLEAALRELGDLLGVRGEPAWVHQALWKLGIPQYEVGYGRILSSMHDFESRYPGLALAGNFRNGVAVPDLVDTSVSIASSLKAELDSPQANSHG